jgi:phosphatidylglycerophosphatase C
MAGTGGSRAGKTAAAFHTSSATVYSGRTSDLEMNLALFDFDGTITNADTFTPFVYFAVGRARIVLGALLLAPMIIGYKLSFVSSTRLRAAIVRIGFRGRAHAEVLALGARYSKQTIASVVRADALERIRWHKAQGDTVVVVSASLSAYLRTWCEDLGLDLICTELEVAGGRLTGRFANGDCTGSEKARRVRAQYDISRYPVVYAYGDTSEDRQLLELAHKRYFRGRELPSESPKAI